MQITFNPHDPADWAHVLAMGAAFGVTVVPGNDDDEDGPADSAAPAVDAFGTPWLVNFHTPKRTRNADGSWRRKKGLTAAEKQAAEAAESAARVSVGTPAAAHDAPPPGGWQPPAGTGPAQVMHVAGNTVNGCAAIVAQPGLPLTPQPATAGIPSPLTPAAAPTLPVPAAPTMPAAPVPVEAVWSKINDVQTKFPGQLTPTVWTDMLIKSFGVATNDVIETDETGRGKLIAEIYQRFGV